MGLQHQVVSHVRQHATRNDAESDDTAPNLRVEATDAYAKG